MLLWRVPRLVLDEISAGSIGCMGYVTDAVPRLLRGRPGGAVGGNPRETHFITRRANPNHSYLDREYHAPDPANEDQSVRNLRDDIWTDRYPCCCWPRNDDSRVMG